MTYLDDHWNDPFDSLRNRGRLDHGDLAQDSLPGAYLETDDGRFNAGSVEYLQFATERGDLEGLIAEGWLTREGITRAEDTMRRLLQEAGVPGAESLSATDQTGGDEPNVDFSIAIPARSGATLGEVFEKVLDPFFATVQNVTDPGSFGRPYLWNEVSR